MIKQIEINMSTDLRNKTILVGRDADSGRLLISIKINGQPRNAMIGNINSVPNCVSRCKPERNVAHCKIDVLNDSSMLLTNIKPENLTFVNGSDITSKRIDINSHVSLGKDMYPINIGNVITAANKLLGIIPPPPPPPEKKSIKHLEAIWKEYNDDIKKIKLVQQNRAKQRLIPIMISSVLGVVSTVLSLILGPRSLMISIPISLIPLFFYIKLFQEKDTSIEDQEKAEEKLEQRYRCPHDGCKCYLGKVPYITLAQHKKCNFCGGGWVS